MKKNVKRKKVSKKSDFEKRVDRFDDSIENFEAGIDKDFKVVEKWMIQRKKFFIKLILVTILIIILLLISLLLSA